MRAKQIQRVFQRPFREALICTHLENILNVSSIQMKSATSESHKSDSQTQLLNKDAEREEKRKRDSMMFTAGQTFSRNIHAKT